MVKVDIYSIYGGGSCWSIVRNSPNLSAIDARYLFSYNALFHSSAVKKKVEMGRHWTQKQPLPTISRNIDKMTNFDRKFGLINFGFCFTTGKLPLKRPYTQYKNSYPNCITPPPIYPDPHPPPPLLIHIGRP